MAKVDQHAVSRFYLQRFASVTGNQILWQYDKHAGIKKRPKMISPKAATTERYLYSVQRPDGTWDDTLEDAFSKLESLSAPSLKELVEGREISAYSRLMLSVFIGAMFLKVSGPREHAERAKSRMETPEATIAFTKEKFDRLRRKIPEAEIIRFIEDVQQRGKGVTMPKNYHLDNVFERAVNIAGRIENMRWIVAKAPKGTCFITSDTPAFCRRPVTPFDERMVGLDRDDLKVELGFPLSSERFLIAKWGDGPRLKFEKVSKSRVDALNLRTVLSANRHVFSPVRSDYIAELVAEHSDFRMELFMQNPGL